MDARVNNHTKQDLIDYGFLEVFWLMFPETYFYITTIVCYTSRALLAEGHQKTTTGELTRFLGCIFFMVCTSDFAKEEYWSLKSVSMMEGTVSLRFYSSSSSYFIASQFCFHPLTTTYSHGG